MSGGHFDYAQYRIDDIIGSIEREIEKATCERPPVVVKNGVSVCLLEGENRKCYVYHYRFKTFGEAETYFMRNANYKIYEKPKPIEGGMRMLVQDRFTDEIYEVKSYTYEEYEPDENGEIPYYPDYTPETIQEFKNGIVVLKRASIYAQRIDWLISGDDSENTFHKRLEQDLGKL